MPASPARRRTVAVGCLAVAAVCGTAADRGQPPHRAAAAVVAAPADDGAIGAAGCAGGRPACSPACPCPFDTWPPERPIRYGYGVMADPARAAYWYRKAAEAGDPRAQYNLGLILKLGAGVERDDAAARAWLRAAAERGLAEASYVLGTMHRTGRGGGGAPDPAAAVAWYRHGASQGHAPSQHALANMYGNGHGVTRDLVAAYIWWQLAAERGLEMARAAHDRAAELMAPRHVRIARRRAAAWAPRAADP